MNLPKAPAGMKWVERGKGWKNDGNPAIHCAKSKAGAKFTVYPVAKVPAGGPLFYYWEAVPSKTNPVRSITPVLAIPVPGEAPVVAGDPDLGAAWDAWRGTRAGQANIGVRGIDVSRLWTIMEARVKAAFEAGYNSRNTH